MEEGKIEEKQTAEATAAVKEEISGKMDTYLIGIYVTLCIMSIVESFSASAQEIAMTGSVYGPIIKHIIFLMIGTVLMIWIAKKDFIKFPMPSIIFSVLVVVLLILTKFIGQNINGAQRSISLLGFTVQPAELSKIAVVFLLAILLASNIKDKSVSKVGLFSCGLVVGVFGSLLVMQGMTNTLLFMGISISMLLIGGISWKQLGKVLLFYIVFGGALYIVKSIHEESRLEDLDGLEQVEAKPMMRSETWQNRLTAWVEEVFDEDPWTNEGILEEPQKRHSYMAQANGGLIGVGPGQSRETSRLPLAFSDYVYSIVVEDLGFLGGLFVAALYFCILFRAGQIAKKSRRAYPAMLVMGMATLIVMQAYFHMAINTGVFPVSGQNLPLISKGGTSIFVICAAFGVMLSVSRTLPKGKKKNTIEEKLPDSIMAANPTAES